MEPKSECFWGPLLRHQQQGGVEIAGFIMFRVGLEREREKIKSIMERERENPMKVGIAVI